jgi:hypothetical protein
MTFDETTQTDAQTDAITAHVQVSDIHEVNGAVKIPAIIAAQIGATNFHQSIIDEIDLSDIIKSPIQLIFLYNSNISLSFHASQKSFEFFHNKDSVHLPLISSHIIVENLSDKNLLCSWVTSKNISIKFVTFIFSGFGFLLILFNISLIVDIFIFCSRERSVYSCEFQIEFKSSNFISFNISFKASSFIQHLLNQSKIDFGFF